MKARECTVKQFENGDWKVTFINTKDNPHHYGPFEFIEKFAFDELTAEKQHFETLYKVTVVDCEREIAVLRAENEKLKFELERWKKHDTDLINVLNDELTDTRRCKNELIEILKFYAKQEWASEGIYPTNLHAKEALAKYGGGK